MGRGNRVAVTAAAEGWVADCGPGAEPNLGNSLRALGQNPAGALDIGGACKGATNEARKLGIFGLVGQELFWGGDHIDDAIAWPRDGRLTR